MISEDRVVTDFIYTAADIETITYGRIVLKTLNHWATKNLWFFPPQPVERGYARRFSRLQLIEASIASECGAYGIPRAAVKMFFWQRAHQLRGPAAGYAGVPTGFPEFDPDSQWYWACHFHGSFDRVGGDETNVSFGTAAAVPFTDRERLAEYAASHLSVLILNVGEIVRRVDNQVSAVNRG